MAELDRDTLKQFFEKGDFPSEAQFSDFIDSCLNLIDDPSGLGDMLKSIYDTDNSGVVDNSELINGDSVANDSAVQANTSKVSYSDSGNVVLLSDNQTIEGLKTFSQFPVIAGQIAQDLQVGVNSFAFSFVGSGAAGSSSFQHNITGAEILASKRSTPTKIKRINETQEGDARLFAFIHTDSGEPIINNEWNMTWDEFGILLEEIAGSEFLGIRYNTEPNTYSDGTLISKKWFDDKIAAPFEFGSQAHGGNSLETFSAAKTFDADNGNNQKMLVTASTTIETLNELPGTYVYVLEIDTITPPTITIGTSFGTVLDNSADLINADNDINILTLLVDSEGNKYYTINTLTA